MQTELFSLGKSDFVKGAIMAVFVGFLMPIANAVQTPNFSIATANWHYVFVFALNSGLVAFVAYLAKQFLSNQQGKFLGRIG